MIAGQKMLGLRAGLSSLFVLVVAVACGGEGDTCSSPCNGTCNAGRCLVTLASGQSLLGGIAVDATSVYWTDADRCTIGMNLFV
jgi:hypothetical protein